MPDDLGKAFKEAANPPDPPGGGPETPPITPSEQVANHAPEPRPQPPKVIGLAVDGQIYRQATWKDGDRSDKNNNYTRPQSETSKAHLETLGKLFAKQAQNRSMTQAKTIDRNHERERGDD